jgi:hypothetical protein
VSDYYREAITPIVDRVAEYYKVTPEVIYGKETRKKIPARARTMCMHFIRKRLGFSFPEIAAVMGGRDNSTVHHALRVLAKNRESDPSLQRDLAALEELLEEPKPSAAGMIVDFPQQVWAQLDELRQTGMFGDTHEAVVQRLATLKLYELTHLKEDE